MIRTLAIFIFLFVIGAGCVSQKNQDQQATADNPIKLRIAQDEQAGTISVFRADGQEPILTQNAKADFRPYLHPLVAPDGKGHGAKAFQTPVIAEF